MFRKKGTLDEARSPHRIPGTAPDWRRFADAMPAAGAISSLRSFVSELP
jgi:hypothetical protein